ncbi:hypothetical protein RQM59_13010 [Flavobacteriaceae bacterium S356]|uniref:Uncharacterized protein n=1 Tax=Asprobacillus argus TaxID=3076534 RepID=A0ABU3LJS1_9FLAO|nr:hypothetical protein [Flavobacteriaceae bacterium S356]
MKKLNLNLLTIAFVIANLLWIKSLIDIYNYSDIRPSFSFPTFFNILFFAGAGITILLSGMYLKWIFKQKLITPISGKWVLIFWLAIPLSVICVSPVCYSGNIFIAAYPASAVIRISLLVLPIIAAMLYYNNKKEAAIFLLLMMSLLLLIPNDKCRNPFNYWWIQKVGASPLTYLPTMFVILFSIGGLYGKNKYLTTVIIYGLCAGALFLAMGHRIKLLW